MSPTPAYLGISVVVPVYNASETIAELIRQLDQVLTRRDEVILVDDASQDASWVAIEELAAGRRAVTGIRLRRNAGQHAATLRGIMAATRPVVVTMDDDLQHDPADIPRLVARLNEGWDVVYGISPHYKQAAWRNLASWLLKKSMQIAMQVRSVENTSPFRAFKTELREAFEHYDGPYVSIDVLLSWATERFTTVPATHHERFAGRSNYTIRKLVRHALNMVTGFSAWPLRIASLVGFLATLFGLLVLAYVLGRYILSGGTTVPGFPFLASAIAIFSGVQLFALGIMGEYLARLHFRAMKRPHSVVECIVGRSVDEGAR